jgi:tetratricopeptide (TPR) repeat protein
MKKIETLFAGISLLAVIIVTGAAVWHFGRPARLSAPGYEYPATKFGAFLAGQHAIYANDFDRAAEFAQEFKDSDLPIVLNTVILSDFLSGRLPPKADALRDEKGGAAQLVYDAHLLDKGDWQGVYDRHKKDDSALGAPLRIWSSVAVGKSDDALKFIDKLKTNDSWMAFVRGQVYVETDRPDKAAKQFEQVSIEFMNINDYLYIVSFYRHFGMDAAADRLQTEFTEYPGGMYMLNVGIQADWANYSGLNNALAFGLIQNVSHTQVMMYSDLSLLMLRFAELARREKSPNSDALNYYLGQYFYNNGGDYGKYFLSIGKNSPFYSFAMMKIAEKTGDISELKAAAEANPLFVPAVAKLVAKHVQTGEKKKALRVAERALGHKNLTETGRAFFLKIRANIHLAFDDPNAAQADIRAAADVLPTDAEILAIQSRIWSAEKRDLNTAYEYAIALVRQNPTSIEFWDTLGMAVWAKEGAQAALEVIERVGQISETCSVLFEHLGDLHAEMGNKKLARDAYLRAIDLSDDGLTVVPKLKKKIKNLRVRNY